MKRKFLSLLMAFVMLMSLVPSAFAAQASDFNDVSKADWYYDSVDYVAKQGYFTGTGNNTFSPNTSMTRAMFVAVLARLDGVTVDDNVSPFADVPAGAWYAGEVAWAVEKGLASGVDSNSFAPEKAVTRQQMASFMAHYIAYYEEKNDVTIKTDGAAGMFSDEGKIASYAKDAVALCTSYGLISGYPDGSFDPEGIASRAQVASVIYRLAKLLGIENVDTDDKTDTEKTDEEKTDNKKTGSGTPIGHGSSSGGGSSTNTSEEEAATAADFKKAAEKKYATVTATIVEGNSLTVNDDVTINNDSVKSLTLNLGNAKLGNLVINSDSAKTIVINADTRASVKSLNINAPNATVDNNVTVDGTVTITAVSNSTFNNYAKTGNIIMNGPGAVKDTQETPAKVVVDTTEEVIVKGNSDRIQVVADNKKLTVSTQVAAIVESSAAAAEVVINTNSPVTINGKLNSVKTNTTEPVLVVDGTVGTVKTAVASSTIEISGSGTITSMVANQTAVTIKASEATDESKATLSVGTVSATSGGSITAPANTIEKVEVTGSVTLAAPVQTVAAAAGATLELKDNATVQTVEAEGNLKLTGSGEVVSVDVQNTSAAQITVTDVAVAQVTKTETTDNVTVSGVETTVQTKAKKPTDVKAVEPTEANGQGKITGVNDTMEYKNGTATWTDVTSGATEITNLAPGTYQVRVKATDGVLASEAVTVTIPAAVGVTKAEIQGTAYVGQTLTAVANADATGEVRYQWTDEDGNELGTEKTLKLTDSMIGKKIKVEIYNYTRTENTDSKTSSKTAAVIVDKTALGNLNAKAYEVTQGITVKDNGTAASAVPKGVRFVTTDEDTAIANAKAAASEVIGNKNATTAEVTAQETAMRTAIDTYEKAIKVGTLTETDKLKAALGDLVTKAEDVRIGVEESTAAENVVPGIKWVTSDVATAYGNAINAAAKIKTSDSATATELANAITELNAAISTYIKAIQTGAELDSSALLAAINAAYINVASVEVSENGADVLPSNNWVTSGSKEAYEAAIKVAEGAISGTNVDKTQSVYIEALSTLDAATTTFNASKKAGTKDIIAPVITNITATKNGDTATIVFTTNEAGKYKVGSGEDTDINVAGEVSVTVSNYTEGVITVTVTDVSGNETIFTVTPTSNVVRVGDTNYETLAAAMAAANSTDGEQTITLLKNITVDTGFDITKKITLEMNGKTIKTNVYQLFSIGETGDLTIKGNGTINGPTGAEAAKLDTKSMICVEGENAKLTILNGTLTAGGVDDCGMYGLYALNGGNIILGDEYTNEGPTITTWFAPIGENNTTSPANVTIYGGEYTELAYPVVNNKEAWWYYFCAPIYASASGTIDIYGGTFNGYYGISSRYINVDQTVNIYGGTFNGEAQALFVDDVNPTKKEEDIKDKTMNVTGGIFSSSPVGYGVDDKYDVIYDEDDETYKVVRKSTLPTVAKVNGESYTSLIGAFNAVTSEEEEESTDSITIKLEADYTINTDPFTTYLLPDGATLDLNGHTLTVPFATAVFEGTNITIKNGTIESDANYAIRIGNGEYETSATLEGITSNGGVNVFAADAILKDCNIDASSKEYYAVWGDSGNVNITIESGTYKGKPDGFVVDMYGASSAKNNGPATINIEGGTFYKPIKVEGSGEYAGKVIITGGTFDNEPDKEFIKADYEAVKDEGKDVWYVVETTDSQSNEQNGNTENNNENNENNEGNNETSLTTETTTSTTTEKTTDTTEETKTKEQTTEEAESDDEEA